ncbi:type II toxin-antitoxin system RelE/ParE family toxin [Pseudomonas atacamensis]|uniref:type II toxin-antitoxin system RelE/ParE family toxin n=1 Tax=Pseudomonas atacamensis TaxID=2565368 RepID=UPI00295871D7|nr:type II toxin-antitoxin system RelE/ParE family toxin [Pseudomonas atacamensis]
MDALPVSWSKPALGDLADIIEYVEQRNTVASVALHQKLSAAARRLSWIPHGFRSGRIPGTREMVINSNYLLVYRVTDHINILTVLHASKKYP